VNGKTVRQAELSTGDRIVAGGTEFLAYVLPSEVVDSFSRGGLPQFDTLDQLRSYLVLACRREPLFLLLDAARDPAIFQMIAASGDESQCLYEGASAVDLARYAPYLVRLAFPSRTLEKLVRDGWGKSWGVLITATASLPELRRHFRKFLLVDAEGRDLYFRFYDPRVLREFLESWTPGELEEFYGPVQRFFLERPDLGAIQEYRRSSAGLTCRTIPLQSVLPSDEGKV
jgi:hypothetical protein